MTLKKNGTVESNQVAYPVPILMYHAVHPERSVISISPLVFTEQIQWLHDRDYQVMTLSTLADLLLRRADLPPKSIVITFDDGFESLMDYALPILDRFGYTATIFLVAGYCGKSNGWAGQPATIPEWPLLSWRSIREIDRLGYDFGAHSMTHPRLDLLSSEESKTEILGSKELIEDQLGHEVSSFSYPYGRYNLGVKSIVAETYKLACGTRPGLVAAKSDRWSLERIEISYVTNKRIFRGMDNDWFSAYLSSRRAFRSIASTFLRRKWY